MRTLLLLTLMMGVAAGGTDLSTTSHRKISRGWGCGGNCAVSISGESDTSIKTTSTEIQLEDAGKTQERENDPGGSAVTTTSWKYSFQGMVADSDTGREFDLHTDSSECKRTLETTEDGKEKSSKELMCTGPPENWKLACKRSEVDVKGKKRAAWTCSPSDGVDVFGTEFPWVFGIDAPITTVVSGEPHARTTYE